jgi:hypothetical protein
MKKFFLKISVIGHAPSHSSAVDYRVRKNDDGSVSCFVGAIDLPSRTRWSVEINLPKDKAYFTRASLFKIKCFVFVTFSRISSICLSHKLFVRMTCQ